MALIRREGDFQAQSLIGPKLELTRPDALEIVARTKDAKGQEQPTVPDSARLDGYTNNWYLWASL